MTEKEIFVEKMRKRTKKFAVEVIIFCDTLKSCKASNLLNNRKELERFLTESSEIIKITSKAKNSTYQLNH